MSDLLNILRESGLPGSEWPIFAFSSVGHYKTRDSGVWVIDNEAAALCEVALMDVLDGDGGLLPYITTGRVYGEDGKWFAEINNHSDPAIMEHGTSRLHALANVYRKLQERYNALDTQEPANEQ